MVVPDDFDHARIVVAGFGQHAAGVAGVQADDAELARRERALLLQHDARHPRHAHVVQHAAFAYHVEQFFRPAEEAREGRGQYGNVHGVARDELVFTLQQRHPLRGVRVARGAFDHLAHHLAGLRGLHGATETHILEHRLHPRLGAFHALVEALERLAQPFSALPFLELDGHRRHAAGAHPAHRAADRLLDFPVLARLQVVHEHVLAVFAQLGQVVFVLDDETLEKEGRLQPGTVQLCDIHSRPQMADIHFHLHRDSRSLKHRAANIAAACRAKPASGLAPMQWRVAKGEIRPCPDEEGM